MTQHQWHRIAFPIRIVLSVMVILAVAMPGLISMPAALAQDAPAPILPAQIGGGDGLDLTIVGMGTVDAGSGTHLTLERVSVQPDTEFQPNPNPAAALIVVESGSILSEDERGFFSRLAAPFHVVTDAGDTSSRTSSEATTFLRLSMADKPPAPAAIEGVEVEVVASLVTNQATAGSAQFFIATANLAPDMASLRLDQTGHTGLSVRQGTVEVLSPSGLEGKLETGASIIFPQSMPMNLLGTAGTEATALFFGMTDASDPSSILPTTVMDACRNKDASVCTPTGSILPNGEAWLHPDASLTLNGTTGGSATWFSDTTMTLSFTYANTGTSPVEFSVAPGSVAVAYGGGGAWSPVGDADYVFALQPGDADTVTIEFTPPEGAGEGSVVISVPQFGGVSGAQWQGVVELLTITLPGSTLAFGESWKAEGEELKVDAVWTDGSGSFPGILTLALTYTNLRNEPYELSVEPNLIKSSTIGGARSHVESPRSLDYLLQPGESVSIEIDYRPSPSYQAMRPSDLMVSVVEFGEITDAIWQGDGT